MKYSAVLASVATLASLVSALPHAQEQEFEPIPESIAHLFPRQQPSKACSNLTGGVHVIGVPGEGFADPPYGLLTTLANSILQAIPGSTNVSVPYNHSNTNGLQQTQDATVTLDLYIKQYKYYCPNTKIVLIGYSSGAVDVMNSLCGESPPYNPAAPAMNHTIYGNTIIAAVTYGDETRTAGSAWNRGNCTTPGLHARPNPAGCLPYQNIIRNFCDDTDPMCCPASGGNISAHYVYPTEYDAIATKFIVSKFKAALTGSKKNKKHNHNHN